ncbi:tyrosine-protein phosphatase non-receptor type 1-like [Diadema setosum]|uniref:tyrosine-protein phosphatase non-receptor type 1-like n=1 Tax=Diadema setosum TaxID=31175 RepID=UPI003B3B1F0C
MTDKGQPNMQSLEDEFEEYEERKMWPTLFWDIQKESSCYELLTTDAKDPVNKGLNRYRDIHPYNHTRIHLKRGEVNYINASLIEAPLSKRKYILTQGPLERTVGHFWQMIWEQKTRAIIMLNNFVENHQQKCADYFPRGQDNGNTDTLICEDTLFKVTYLRQERHHYYIVRTLLLEDLVSQDTKEILHFHYTRWSDFSVPQSPAAFLHFLHHVRQSGSLLDNVGPPVIHCSAGVGRSGTLCLVDSCLVQIEKKGHTSGMNVKQQLLDMRRYRQGLIQTWQQLRFSYCAILEGSKVILRGDSLGSLVVENDADCDSIPPPLPPKRPLSRPQMMADGQAATREAEENNKQNKTKAAAKDGLVDRAQTAGVVDASSNADKNSRVQDREGQELRKRKREEREEKSAKLNEKINEMRRKQRRAEAWQQKRSLIRLGMGVGVGVAVSLAVVYFYLS